jgi:hypothetical protein
MSNHYQCVVQVPQYAFSRMDAAESVSYIQDRIYKDVARYIARNFRPTYGESGEGASVALDLFIFTPDELKKYVAGQL